MAITGPGIIDTYGMISSLADNYLKNRDAQQQYSQREKASQAQEALAQKMEQGMGQNKTPDYFTMASHAMRMGNVPQAQALYQMGVKQAQQGGNQGSGMPRGQAIGQEMRQAMGQGRPQQAIPQQVNLPQYAGLPPERPPFPPQPQQAFMPMGHNFGIPRQGFEQGMGQGMEPVSGLTYANPQSPEEMRYWNSYR